MATRDTDIRAVSLVDIPLIRRLSDQATVLDSEMAFTRDSHSPNSAIISNILLPQRGYATLVARTNQQQVVGQFRVRGSGQYAQITYIAPHLPDNVEDTVWLHILEAMTREAGKHQVNALVAEVNEDSHLFETMRTAGFAVYARQQIWQRLPTQGPVPATEVRLLPEDEVDLYSLQLLVAQIVPSLIQSISMPLDECNGWVYRDKKRIKAYVHVVEGKYGIYLVPYIHPDVMEQAEDILAGVIQRVNRSNRLPVYVCLRRHQDWLKSPVSALGFEPGPHQAVMVKHITARVRPSRVETVTNGLKAITTRAQQPRSPVIQW